MKKGKNGFMLVETLIVSTLVSTVLVVLYVQFNNIIKNYNKNFDYNSVGSLYAANNIKKFIFQDNNGNFYTNLKSYLNQSIVSDSNYYLKVLTTCDDNYSNAYRTNSCEKFSKLTSFYGIKQIIFTMEYIDLKDSDYTELNSPNFVTFIKNINTNKDAVIDENNNPVYDYRIIIEFENNKFATLKISD